MSPRSYAMCEYCKKTFSLSKLVLFHRLIVSILIMAKYAPEKLNPNAVICGNMIDKLLKIKNAGKIDEVTIGAAEMMDDMQEILRLSWQEWQYFTGDDEFPVPVEGRSSREGFAELSSRGEVWKYEQLTYRIRLLEHILANIESTISKL